MSRVPFTSSVQPPQPEPLSLEERIRRAELRLIAREDSIGRRIDLLGDRLQEVLRPARYIAPAIGAAVAGLSLWMMLSRRRVRPAAPARAAPRRVGRMLGELPWMHMLALVWPLVPGRWRTRVSPATVATVVSVGLPLAERLFTPRPRRRR
jgi:apolipoprotein D and lipocalin family protein